MNFERGSGFDAQLFRGAAFLHKHFEIAIAVDQGVRLFRRSLLVMRFEIVDGDAANFKRNVFLLGDGLECLNVSGRDIGNNIAEPVDMGHTTVEGPVSHLGLLNR